MAQAEPAAPQTPTSRLCVKNIPKYVDEKRLREHFSTKGEVTDVKILRTKDGKSRCFGFVGLKSPEQAAAAHKYFNKSFMDTCRLEIEFAESVAVRASAGAKPWSKHSASKAGPAASVAAHGKAPDGKDGSSGGKKRDKANAKAPAVTLLDEDDPQLAEFLDLMKARSTTKSYANDEVAPLAALAKGAGRPSGRAQAAHVLPAGADAADDEDDDDAEYQDLTAPAARGLARSPAKASGKRIDERSQRRGAQHAHVEASSSEDGRDDDVMDDDISDMAYLRSRMRASLDEAEDDEGPKEDADAVEPADGGRDAPEDDEEDEQPDGAGSDADERSQPAETSGRGGFSEDPEALILQTGRLFVRNLPYVTTDEELTAAFAEFGAVIDVHLARDSASRRSKGFGHVQFADAADAVAAFRALDGTIFQGRLLHLLPGKRPLVRKGAGTEETPPSGAPGTFKAAREAARKEDAGNRSAWSTLYMRQDTVAEAVAAVLGIDKAELLDPEASDVAVRLALGETQVVALTKKHLEDAGVNIAAIEAAAAASGKAAETQHVARSKRVLLLKNLPYSADAGELAALFEKFGGVERLILPDTRTMAVVELTDDQAARRAFKGLAYKRYHHVPLYLEWAPASIFDAAAITRAPMAKSSAQDASGAEGPSAPAKSKAAAVLTGLVDAEADEVEGDGTTLFVKNLSFATTSEQLRAHFDKAASAIGGAVRSAHISTSKRAGDKVVSRGFGFVELSDRETAKAVLKRLQGSALDSHKLEIQISAGKAPRATPVKVVKEKGVSDTKILVKNLAFEATAKDVRGLLEAFGHVKTCRLPQKFDGTKRGFAFVEFGTKGEAKKAIESVQGTHLYGRRLLLEYAKEDEGLDELRAKTAAKFSDDPPAKRRKVQKGLGFDEAID